MRCNAEFYYVGKNPTFTYLAPVAVMHGVKMVYSPQAVGTTLAEVQALHRVLF